tara:strand:+ start:172 stop:585 length:414 start_codon:yes stop_codon:yes gene_type:complete
MSEKLFIKWELFDMMISDIADEYSDKNIKRIVGLSRGGLPMGVALSNKMGVPFIPLEWQTRDGKVKDVNKLLMIKGVYDSAEVLFVDDICDSGLTINQIKEYVPNSRWATLVNKIPKAVEFETLLVEDDRWIVFPWE